MKKLTRILVAAMASCIALSSTAISASAATKSQTLTYNYYDSIITSWRVGQIKATYTYSYNTSTKKLINQKSIKHSTSNVFGTSFTGISKSWDWYNTTQKNGTGRGTCEWSYGIGVNTTWVNIGWFEDEWMSLTCKGNGTWTSQFS